MKRTFLLAALMASVVAGRAVSVDYGGRISEGSNFRYSYTFGAELGETIRSGDFLVIHDFGALIPDSVTAPDGWSIETPLSSGLATDDPIIPNLFFTYTGPDIEGVADLGVFTALSSEFPDSYRAFVSQTSSGVAVTVIATPFVIGSSVPTPTPDGGATAALLGLGVAGLAFARRKIA
jgi:hypothetical protein